MVICLEHWQNNAEINIGIPDKMKIMTVGYLHGSGGAERQIILLSNQLVGLGHDVTLCVLNENKSPYTIDEKVRMIDLCNEEGTGRLRIWRRYKAFRRAVKKVRPDVIVNYNLQSAYFCLGISKKARGKVVYSERGDPYDKEYSGLLGKIRDLTVAHMDGLVFQSEGARDFFPNKVKEKSVVIHNSVNVPQEKYPMPAVREKRIINVGRLHPQKNQKLLIDAFAKIAPDFPEYNVDIYGDGQLRDELQQQIDSLNLHGRIRLNASRKDIFDCIYKASLFVLTSDYEGMPNALMEAMALGLPCISTDCRPGGARTLIEQGVNGYIVHCGDKDALAQVMKQLLNASEVSERMSCEARKLGISHSNESIFNKWDSFIKTLC